MIERTLRTTPADATNWSIRSTAAETGFSVRLRRRGQRSACSRTAARLSSCRPIRCSSTRCAIPSAFTSRRPTGCLSLALTRKARSRRSIGSSRSRPRRRTRAPDVDHVRHGTTSLFAALDIASGFVIGKCYKRHRAAEFLNFLKQIDARVAEGLEVHIVMDNYATHKTPKIKAWLARRPHYHVHYTPTSASWINQVERWFAELTRKRLRRGVQTQSGSSRPTSAPSSTGTTKTPSLSNGSNQPTKSSLRSNASARKPRRRYAANFRFT